MSSALIPNRPAFRAQEVCEIADVQPYVLRGWEAEFPDLGVAKVPNGPRVYRRSDVERVLRLKHLIQSEGLTLAGARRRLEEEGEPDLLETVAEAERAATGNKPAGATRVQAPRAVKAPVDDDARAHLQEVKQGLEWILQTLSGNGHGQNEFAVAAGKARRKKAVK